MEATIENLRKGLCAVENDGSLDDLRRVLNAAFPKEHRRVWGTETYYYKMGYTDWCGSSYETKLPAWCGSSYGTKLPAFSLQKFIDDLNNQPITNKQRILTSTDEEKIDLLETKLQYCVDNENYERAARLRDEIKILKNT